MLHSLKGEIIWLDASPVHSIYHLKAPLLILGPGTNFKQGVKGSCMNRPTSQTPGTSSGGPVAQRDLFQFREQSTESRDFLGSSLHSAKAYWHGDDASMMELT